MNSKSYIFLLFSLNVLISNEIAEMDFVLGFWPEYDRHETLVMVQINIPENQLPFLANLQIPESVDTVFVLRMSQQDKSMNPFKTENSGIWNIVMDETNYYMQFYLPIEKTEQERHFDFIFNLDVPLNQYHIVIQEPLQSENFTSNLEKVEKVTDEFTLKYHRSHYKNYSAGESKNVHFHYSRNTVIPTLMLLEQIMADHSQFINPESEEPIKENDMKQKFDLSIKYGFLFSLLTIGCVAAFYMVYGNRSKIQPAAKKLNYCPFCGSPSKAESSQNYCSNCGEKLNVS